jgi:hypothetical protein
MAVSASPSKMKSSTSKLPRRMESIERYTCVLGEVVDLFGVCVRLRGWIDGVCHICIAITIITTTRADWQPNKNVFECSPPRASSSGRAC